MHYGYEKLKSYMKILTKSITYILIKINATNCKMRFLSVMPRFHKHHSKVVFFNYQIYTVTELNVICSTQPRYSLATLIIMNNFIKVAKITFALY